jgi:hypothetical protein
MEIVVENTLGSGSTEEFVSREFASLNLLDKRLVERAKSILSTLQRKLGSTIRRVFLEPKEARQAYDFLGNPKVTGDKLMNCHYGETVERIRNSDAKYILAIQDQMRLNFTSHPAKTELGSIGKTKNTEQYGLIQHSILCVTDQNNPLGLMDVKHLDYSEIETGIGRDKRAVEDKISNYWIAAVEAMRKRLGSTSQRIITVADREGDFYEFIHALIAAGEEFIIRAKHDRITGDIYNQKGKKLWSLLETAPVNGSMEVEIQDVDSREIKMIQLNLKAIEITIPVPKKMTVEQIERHNYKAIKVNAVIASNAEHEWVLLTNLSIDTTEQVKQIVEMYKQRWHIEDFHKILKTGYQVDEIYLHSSRRAIENLLMLASISACRLYWLIYVGRTEPSIKAEQVFEEFEWKAVYVFFKEKIPEECPVLSEVILKIAQMGGYKPARKVTPPGIKTMWTGFQHFTIAAQMYRNMSMKT